MLETPHVAAGAAIATKVGNPLLALPLALASHFLLDTVPHWNPHLNKELKSLGKVSKSSTILVTIDSFSAIGVGLLFASTAPDMTKAITILAGAFLGVLPDVVEAPYYFLGQRNAAIEKFIKWQKSIQWDTNPIFGFATQILVIALSCWWVFGV